jgi:hypothetical protein
VIFSTIKVKRILLFNLNLLAPLIKPGAFEAATPIGVAQLI